MLKKLERKDSEIKCLEDNLSNEEYTQVIPIEERWHEYMNEVIQDLKDFMDSISINPKQPDEHRDEYFESLKYLMEAIEKQPVSYYAKRDPDKTIDIIVKNETGDIIEGLHLNIDYQTFLEIYKILDMENNM